MNTSLLKLIKSEKIPHSLLLIGGTKTDGLDFAKALLGRNSEKIDSGNHPDIHIYEPEGKTQKHTMASMQKLIQEMALPPFEAPFKIFIIQAAEKMLPSASNSLLKTLEEPNNDAYLLFLSDEPDSLLPTILSRLAPVRIATKEPTTLDLSPYFALAKEEAYDELISHLDTLEEEDPKALLQAVLVYARNTPDNFLKFSKLVLEAERALNHNLKPKTVLLNLILRDWL